MESFQSKENFALICFLVLMQNGEGLKDNAPVYILEKKSMLNAGYDAFGYLDQDNQNKVIAWYREWKKELPAFLMEDNKTD